MRSGSYLVWFVEGGREGRRERAKDMNVLSAIS